MIVDADSLEQLNLRTRDGAEQAGAAFADALEAETRVGATKIKLASERDLIAELAAESEECIEFTLDGALSGTVLLAFDDDARAAIAADDSTKGRIADVAVELIGAFVREWENHVGGDLTVDTPTYVEDVADHQFSLDAVEDAAESAPLFQTRIHGQDFPGRITLYLAPDASSLETLLSVEADPADSANAAFGMDADAALSTDGDGGASAFDTAEAFGGGSDDAAEAFETDTASDSDSGGLFDDGEEVTSLPLEKLSVFSDLTREGTNTAAERITQMTGIETNTEIAGINFTPVDDISGQLEADDYVGTTTEFEGTPSGHLVILFEAESAAAIAEAMMPMEPEGQGLTDMHVSALEELGNIMTSGFIDGWANVLQTGVDHTPPEFTEDMEMSLVEIVTEQLGPFQTHAYTIESRIETDDIAFDCEIHALPNEAQLSEALDSLLVERSDQTEADPEDLF
jgi:chemotaxis protein CheY-P-specific phosphatase CheC